MKSFGQRLKELRNERNLTQKELAKILMIAIPTLSHWECDYQEPAFKEIKTLSDYFNVSADYLLGRTDDLGAILNPDEGFHTSPMEQQLILSFRKLPAQSQEYIFGIIQNLAAHT